MSAQDTAKTIHDILGVTGAVATGAQGIERLAPAIELIAGFFPGAASVVAALQLAEPYIEMVSRAAPAVRHAIESGAPVFKAIDDTPDLMAAIKEVVAALTNGDPIQKPMGEPLTADDISDEDAIKFAGPLLMGRKWTADEQQRWWDRASAV